jgi:4-aminobutyrate aminotransferase-like enzyme
MCALQFGGNPVSCANVIAVIDVMERQKLREHATRVGNHLLNSLRQLALKHPIIGDVRGVGLFIGIELVEDKDTKIPATARTQHVVSR